MREGIKDTWVLAILARLPSVRHLFTPDNPMANPVWRSKPRTTGSRYHACETQPGPVENRYVAPSGVVGTRVQRLHYNDMRFRKYTPLGRQWRAC